MKTGLNEINDNNIIMMMKCDANGLERRNLLGVERNPSNLCGHGGVSSHVLGPSRYEIFDNWADGSASRVCVKGEEKRGEQTPAPGSIVDDIAEDPCHTPKVRGHAIRRGPKTLPRGKGEEEDTGRIQEL